MAMDRELREIILSEFPVISRYIKADSREIGTVSIIIKVARHLPRKRSTISITTKNVITIVELRLLIDLTMKSL